MVARSDTTPRTQQDRLVAVLQQGPNAPAFLLTFDMQRRTLIIRRVSATAETGKSYELWLISKNLGAPRSLGVIGTDEFTSRNLAGNYDADTLRTANLCGLARAERRFADRGAYRASAVHRPCRRVLAGIAAKNVNDTIY